MIFSTIIKMWSSKSLNALQELHVLSDSDSLSVTTEDYEMFIDLYNDPRVKWFRDRILAFIGMDDEELFYNMLDYEDAKQKFINFLMTTIKSGEMSLNKRMMYVSKVIVDKLIHEDKEFTEWRIIPPVIVEAPPQKGKKGKGKGKEAKKPEGEDGKLAKGKGQKGAKTTKSKIDEILPTTGEMDVETAAGAMIGAGDDDEKIMKEDDGTSVTTEDKYYFPPQISTPCNTISSTDPNLRRADSSTSAPQPSLPLFFTADTRAHTSQ
ncbi:unnamed protein product [Spodoptera littoralis]|uniref:Uncharacterized protein n=1 Tax=Spodoptera littoralis TaxID=7109 RepID=A0A9P0N2M2_SPOLI|nr:unnamed protein product [Spodoptera littoralis]CAH1640177.1 unnamed protein product [Spodoptera littoralis]